jgi:hypothetical protein
MAYASRSRVRILKTIIFCVAVTTTKREPSLEIWQSNTISVLNVCCIPPFISYFSTTGRIDTIHRSQSVRMPSTKSECNCLVDMNHVIIRCACPQLPKRKSSYPNLLLQTMHCRATMRMHYMAHCALLNRAYIHRSRTKRGQVRNW